MLIERLRAMAYAAASTAFLCIPALAAPPQLPVTLAGTSQIMFKPGDGCDGNDVPDLNPRAFRDANGKIVMFALHYVNRALRGESLDTLKTDCRTAYGSGFNPDSSAYDAQNWITATWTKDGTHIEAIVHHEYRAAQYNNCSVPRIGQACWFNTLLAARSDDGGVSFFKHTIPVIASAPFKQDFDQRRHRGFFNPSNIVSHGGAYYFFSAQTGWSGQPYGVCLFRSSDPAKAQGWRAWDGRSFTIAYDDPYKDGMKTPARCKTIQPFPAQVGAVVRHRGSGLYLAVAQAWRDEKLYPVSGFYYATSRDLMTWSDPRLLMATKTLYDDACGASELNSYPSIIDETSPARNFDDTANEAWLYWSSMRVDGCKHTGDRKLLRQKILIQESAGVRRQ